MSAASGVFSVSRKLMLHSRALGFALAASLAFCGAGEAMDRAAHPSTEAHSSDVTVPLGHIIRTVRIDMGPNGFHPRSVTVKAGETVRFVLHNISERETHEFTVGTAAMHRGRRELIEQMSASTPIETRIHNSSPYDAPNAVVVLPGETRELVWTFTSTRRFEFACNIPGHAHMAMRGAFRLLSAADNELDFPAIDRGALARFADRRERPAAPRQAMVTAEAANGTDDGGAFKSTAASAYQTSWRVVKTDTARNSDQTAFSAPTPSGRPAEQSGTTELVHVGDGVFGFSQSIAPQSRGTPKITGVTAGHLASDADIEEVARLGKGHELLAKGQVIKARKLYKLSFEAGVLEAAFALGRSYDPRTVSTLHEPDARPNQKKARHWYRVWYRRSVEEGAVSGAVKLDVFIKGMGGG